jgi:hypothetical protein
MLNNPAKMQIVCMLCKCSTKRILVPGLLLKSVQIKVLFNQTIYIFVRLMGKPELIYAED